MPCFNRFRLDKKIESFLVILLRTTLPKTQGEHLEKALKKTYEEELADPIKSKYRAETRTY